MKIYIFPLFIITVIFGLGCSNNSGTSGGATSTTSITDSVGKSMASPPTSAQAINRIFFGNPHGGGDTTATATAGCSSTGICDPSSQADSAISVLFVYQKGQPSTLQMAFLYKSLFDSQQTKALDFYNSKIINTYQFKSNFALSSLGGTFANVQATINATPAGAGTIVLNPVPAAKTPSSQVTSTVTVTYTVTP